MTYRARPTRDHPHAACGDRVCYDAGRRARRPRRGVPLPRSGSSWTASRGCCPPCTSASATPSTCTARPAAGRCSPPGASGLPVCVAVTAARRPGLARSQFHHSANYRSVVAHGTARLVTDDAEKRRRADRAGGEGRARAGPPTAARRPAGSWPRPPCWRCRCARCRSRPAPAGVERRAGRPRPAALGRGGAAAADRRPARARRRGHRAAARRTCGPAAIAPGTTPVTLRGRARLLEPLDLSHADGLYAATADAEVWPHLAARPADRPPSTGRDRRRRAGRTAPGRAGAVGAAVRPHRRGGRHHLLLRRSTRSGGRSAIGHTMLGRPWWRTGVNTEAKLLLLARAFDDAGRGAGGLAHRHPQRALPAGHRAARRHPGGRAAPAPATPGRLLAGHRAVRDDRRRVAERTGQAAGKASRRRPPAAR